MVITFWNYKRWDFKHSSTSPWYKWSVSGLKGISVVGMIRTVFQGAAQKSTPLGGYGEFRPNFWRPHPAHAHLPPQKNSAQTGAGRVRKSAASAQKNVVTKRSRCGTIRTPVHCASQMVIIGSIRPSEFFRSQVQNSECSH
jgi:hypothetical protein